MLSKLLAYIVKSYISQGEMVLRDGPYVGEADLLLHLAGVFVPASGRLHATLNPAHPLALPFGAADADPASPHYRYSSRQLWMVQAQHLHG